MSVTYISLSHRGREVLHRLIKKAAQEGVLSAPAHQAHHCSIYADDVIVFAAPTLQDTVTIRETLQFFMEPHLDCKPTFRKVWLLLLPVPRPNQPGQAHFAGSHSRISNPIPRAPFITGASQQSTTATNGGLDLSQHPNLEGPLDEQGWQTNNG